ncbi:MAG: peptidylprolyl isomerase [Bacteroidia bacterium]|nr:peptidylprolyl isomerase [Bacteroidia bacterium]
MKKSIWVLIALVGGLLASCGGEKSEEPTGVNRFADEKIRRIYDYQDQRNTAKLIPFLKAKKVKDRMAAVLAFASIRDTAAVKYLKVALLTDEDKEVRKAAAYSIGQLRDTNQVGLLFTALEMEIFPEVREEIFVALGKSANQQVAGYLNTYRTTITELQQGHVQAMYHCLSKRQIGDFFAANAMRYFNPVSSEKTKFYAASIISRMPRMFTDSLRKDCEYASRYTDNEEVKRLLALPFSKAPETARYSWSAFLASSDTLNNRPYEWVNHLRTTDLSDERAIDSLKRWSFDQHFQVVRTTAAELYFKNQSESDKQSEEHTNFMRRCITSRDMALQSLVCYEIVAQPDSAWLDILLRYRDSLAMPRQLETIIDFDKAIAAIKATTFVKPQTDLRHRIDWEHVLTIPSNQQVVMETTKGDITLDLFVDDAPGSVSNFIKLVEEGFYTDKFFHRVVPNFVIQAGCPRGDGWGSLDWTQRSEFSNYQTYSTGTMGLASAGEDTEGVQIFITHNPTPFLDGRYTIFGRVTEGMDVVNSIKVGDKIKRVVKK